MHTGNPNQSVLEMCHETGMTNQQYQEYIAHAEKYGRDLGLNKILDEHNLNIIIAPLDSGLATFAACAGLFDAKRILKSLKVADLHFVQAIPLLLCR